MTLLNKLFKKKQSNQFKTESEIYAYMGSLGVSFESMFKYQEAIKKIKHFEKRYIK
jgi:hypothetical protein